MEACANRNPDFCGIEPADEWHVASAKRTPPPTWRAYLRNVAMDDYGRAHYTRMYHLSTMYWMQVNGAWVRKH